jgi:FkbM family methyltransferase
LLVAAMIMTGAGEGWWSAFDAVFAAALVIAAGLIWSTGQWKAWALATSMVLGGLLASSMDVSGNSAGARARLAYEKVVGHLPYLGWRELGRLVISERFETPAVQRRFQADIRKIEEKAFNGKACERFHTSLGKFWIVAPGEDLLKWIVWEITSQRVYESGGVAIRPGDTVIDAGAHVGVFTRWALQQGARRVVAIEPEPTNILLFEANLAEEIVAGRVTLVKAGVWDHKASLPLFVSDNSARHNFIIIDEGSVSPSVPLRPLDDIVTEYGLERVDFIKMDIEGAERNALQGARRTLERFRPRMAICVYHREDDAAAVPAAARQGLPGYRIWAKDAAFLWFRYLTKTLFFEPPAA